MRQPGISAAATVGYLLLLWTPAPLAADYYVSNSGEDDHPGTSPSKPWKTISKVNRSRFLPGDTIRFERGGIWREQLVPHSGSETGCVTYTSYGSGAKPLLLGSVEKNRTDGWDDEGRNVWSAGPFAQDVGNIIFSDGALCGIKVWAEADLDRQDEFWYDARNRVVKAYSVRNPAALHDDIECALTRHIISQGGKSYVVYDGLHLAYGAAHGIGGGNTHHVAVRNCDLCFIGGGHQYTRPTKAGPRHVRYGNGIEFWSSAHDNLVENCRIWDIYDAGLTNQGSGTNSQYNICYRNNRIWNCEYSFEYWNRPETSVTHDIRFENNACFNAGAGWSHVQRPWPAGVHLMLFANQAQTRSFFIRNNVFHKAENAFINIRTGDWSGLENLMLDGNVHYQPSGKVLVRWGERSYLPSEFGDYQRETGQDANSKLVALQRIVVAPTPLHLVVGQTQQMKVTGVYSEATSIDVTDFASYACSDSSVASIDPAGRLKGLAPGETELGIMFEGLTAKAPVTVKVPESARAASPENAPG